MGLLNFFKSIFSSKTAEVKNETRTIVPSNMLSVDGYLAILLHEASTKGEIKSYHNVTAYFDSIGDIPERPEGFNFKVFESLDNQQISPRVRKFVNKWRLLKMKTTNSELNQLMDLLVNYPRSMNFGFTK